MRQGSPHISPPTLNSSAQFPWAGQQWELHADRAVYWPAAETLIVADLHLGKPAAFRAAGIPVPEQATRADLARLAALIRRTDARRVLFLGDLLHAPTGRSRETLDAFAEFRDAHAATDMVLVRGNHDTRAGDPPAEWAIRCVNEPLCPSVFIGETAGAFQFRHHPPTLAEKPRLPVMAGHLHPGVALNGPARSRLRARCCWVSPMCMILPAFGCFTGLAPISPCPGDRVFAICDDAVIEVPVSCGT